jgi:hypothetical protein
MAVSFIGGENPHHEIYLPPLNSEVILGCIKYMYFIFAKMLVCIYTKTVLEMCLHYIKRIDTTVF